MTRRGRRSGALLVSIAMAIPACRPRPADLLRETTERAHSWIAGADMAADLRTRELVPAGFARIALQEAQKGLEAERAGLGRKPDVLKDPRVEAAVRALDAASMAASRLGDALRHRQAEVEAAREALRAADRDLQAAGGR